jgi:hypothetical protein
MAIAEDAPARLAHSAVNDVDAPSAGVAVGGEHRPLKDPNLLHVPVPVAVDRRGVMSIE